jgi:hypothetical protein
MNRQLTDADVKHLRQLLVWVRGEYCLDEGVRREPQGAVKAMLDAGHVTHEEAYNALSRRAEQAKEVPQYVRHAVEMLSLTVRELSAVAGVAPRAVQAIGGAA